jgi:hypothetical protein
MTLDGCTIVDTAITPERRGTIVGVNADGTVTVSWKPGQITTVRPVPGRYLVTLHDGT